MKLLKVQILEFQLFLTQNMSSMWRAWEDVTKRLQSPSPSRPPKKTLSFIVLTKPRGISLEYSTAEQKDSFVLFLPWNKLLSRILFLLCRLLCCYDYSAFDVIPGFFEAKLALHAQCCNFAVLGDQWSALKVSHFSSSSLPSVNLSQLLTESAVG